MATMQLTQGTALSAAAGDTTTELYAPASRQAASAALPMHCDIPYDMPSNAARLVGALTLRDGTRVRTRPIRPDDTERLRTFHAHLSRDTILFRFFRYMPELSVRDAERFTHLDYVDRMALVATWGGGERTAEGEEERILAVVRYDRIGPTSAEVAFVVADEWQGHGIATALLLQLAEYARARGITRLVAITMASNRRMLEVLRHSGYPSTVRFQDGEDEVYLDIAAPPAAGLAPLPFIPDAAN